MATTATTSNTTAAAEPADGTTTPPVVSPTPTGPTPTVTHYQQLANEFMAALDKIMSIIPKLEAAHSSTEDFVRAYVNVPLKFLGTVTASVEQNAELQDLKRLDVAAARDALQFIDAFTAVDDKLGAFKKSLRFTLNTVKANLGFDALTIYDVAKGLARHPDSAPMSSLVENMKRDLGRKGPSKAVLELRKKTTPTPGIGVPTPRLLASGFASDDAEPRG